MNHNIENKMIKDVTCDSVTKHLVRRIYELEINRCLSERKNS